MSALREYLLRLVCAGLVCAGAAALCPKGKQEILRLCCACILALTALSPLADGELTLPQLSYESEVQQAVDDALTRAAQSTLAQSERALAEEAVRLAGQCGLSVKAEVRCTAGEDDVRVQAVMLQGTPSESFTAALAAQFGIAPSAIEWRE